MNPGPGAYFKDDLAQNSMNTSISTKIGTSRREGTSFYDGQAKKNPGP